MANTVKLLLFVALLGSGVPAFAEDLVVIVNEQRAVRLDREAVAQIFLKKRRFWSDGSAIVPVNRGAGAASRELFDRAVFGSGLRGLAVYWNRAYFRGFLPPATLASDEAIRRFVMSEPRAIGYVHASAVDARDSLRVVLVLPGGSPDSPSETAGESSSR